MALKCTCRTCDHRKLACHDTCETYKAWRKERDRLLEAARAEKEITAQYLRYEYDKRKRLARKDPEHRRRTN